MKSFRAWAFWRRMQYGTGLLLLLSGIYTVIYFAYLQVPVSCFDNEKNGDEAGIDCDGSCTRICAFSVEPPDIEWAKSFKIVDGQYNAVAYIENKNDLAGTPELAYTFKLMQGDEVIAERSGVTILPPDSVYPIFEGRIFTLNNKEPTKTVIELKPANMWLPATIGRDQFRTLDIELLGVDSRPRLNVSVENTKLTDARKVEMVTTIFNRSGEPLTASQTFVDNFPGRSTEKVVFTWPSSIAKTVRSCDVPSDIVLILDRSGSMAADGGIPPEPLESAKQAAKLFVNLVRSQDTLGFLSYATNPSIPMEQVLTSDLDQVIQAIQSTKMGEDGVQYTNMGEAFSVALDELTGSRHREDARKVIVFLTDGDVTRPKNPVTGEADRDYAAQYALDKANEAKKVDVTIYTIGFGDTFQGSNEDVQRDVGLIRDLATDENHYYEAPTVRELRAVYERIAVDICEEGPARIDVITKTATNFAPLR